MEAGGRKVLGLAIEELSGLYSPGDEIAPGAIRE
jgi:hypothetical protein